MPSGARLGRAAGRRRRTSSPSASTSSGGHQAAGGGVLDEDRLRLAGGDAPQAEVVRRRPDDVLAQRALEVAVGADRLHVLDPVMRRRASAASPARPRAPPGSPCASASPASSTETARDALLEQPPDRGRGAQVRACARRSSRACSIAGRDVCRRGGQRAARPRRRSCSGSGSSSDQHADRARRAAERRPRAADSIPKVLGPPARDQGRRRASRRPPARRSASAASAAGSRTGGAAHQLPFGAIARAVRVARGARHQAAVLDQQHGRPARSDQCAPCARRASSSISSSEPAAERGLRQLEQELGLGALAVALDRAGHAADARPPRAGAASAAPATPRRPPARSRASRPGLPASSGSKRTEPIAEVGGELGRDALVVLRVVDLDRAAPRAAPLTATGICVERDARPTRRGGRRCAGRVDGIGDHRLRAGRRRATRSRAPLRRPRARPCTGGQPTRRPPAAMQLACPQKSARHGFPPRPARRDAAPCAPRCYLPA